jgi:DNA gyrase subunit A
MVTNAEAGNIRPVNIEEEMRGSYLDYAMSVIVSRAIPDARDGLKPVQRRILFAMHEMGITPTGSYRKSARIVGEVMGKYHPHGDSAVYDALVRMAQPFSINMPLIDGQGNFGSIDNDPPAAMRYTEARLLSITQELLANIEQQTVDFIDNFDGSLKEPVVLPSRFPNLLVNGASGIAVGMATSIPPHNLSELCGAIELLLDNPDATADELMELVLGPDFPTAAIIMGTDGIQNAYATGHGRVVIQARTAIKDFEKTGRQQILVTELPYQVNKAALVEQIAKLIRDRRVDGVSEIRDESDRDGIRVVLDLRRDAQPDKILANLYEHTSMQSTFPINMLALVDGTPKVVTLKQALTYYIGFRRQVVERRSGFELRKARERAHILEGLRVAINNLDSVIALIRKSEDVEAARNGLMETFNLDQIQAQSILDMQLRRLASLERQKIENEFLEIAKIIEELETLLGDPRKILDIVKDETEKLNEKFGTPRRTEINEEEARRRTRAELEPHQEVVVTLTKSGYITRTPSITYRNQHRGGKGVLGMVTKDNDPIQHLLVADTHDDILFFTDRGKVFSLKCFELRPDSSRTSRGVPLINIINIDPHERVNAIIAVPSLEEDAYLFMATRKGLVKRLALKAVAKIRRSGLIVMNLKKNDELVSVHPLRADDDVMMVSEMGQSIRFHCSEVTPHSRTAGGIIGMRLNPGDKIVAMDVIVPDGYLLVVSKHGYGKVTAFARYKTQKRAGKGIKTLHITKKTGLVADAVVSAKPDQEIFLVSQKAQVFRTSIEEIPPRGRNTQGVILWKPGSSDSVASVELVDQSRLLTFSSSNNDTNTALNESQPNDEPGK